MTEIITPDNPEAAKYVVNHTVTGWISRHGRYYGEGKSAEDVARKDGSTHTRCRDCGTPFEKSGWLICPECRERQDAKRKRDWYDSFTESKPWDDDTPVYSISENRWFYAFDEADDYAAEDNIPIKDLLLVFGVPVYPTPVYAEEVYSAHLENNEYECDDLAPAEVQKAFDELNEKLRFCPPLTYSAPTHWGYGCRVDLSNWIDSEP